MSQQFIGDLVICGPFAGTSSFGITNPSAMARAGMWTHGAFGVSVTSSVVGGTAGVAVWGDIYGVSIKIAEITGLRGLSRFPMFLVTEHSQYVVGTTQALLAGNGVLNPRSVIVTGVSTGIGITFGCVVTASLLRI